MALRNARIYRFMNKGKFTVKNLDLGATDTSSDADDEWIEFWKNMRDKDSKFLCC